MYAQWSNISHAFIGKYMHGRLVIDDEEDMTKRDPAGADTDKPAAEGEREKAVLRKTANSTKVRGT